MGYKVLITGSTGMVGKGVLLECLDHADISSILVINRKPVGIVHPKLTEILQQDFHNFTNLESSFSHLDACFFCLGISALGKSEEEYSKITYHVTMDLARPLVRHSPKMVFCFVSGAGTNINGRSMWSRVKGKTELDLQTLPFRKVALFRPGFIQPMRGIKSSTGWINVLLTILSPFFGLINSINSKHITNSINIGLAMINCITQDDHPAFLENQDINRLAKNPTL